MINFLNKIFISSEFDNNFTRYNSDKIDFFYKENQEYFIVSEYNLEELNDFFRCKKTNNIVTFLDNFKNEFTNLEWIDKDTSLIISIKATNLRKDFEKIKNQIMKIEEDEYFFRKYIIIYDDDWIKLLNKINSLEKLNKELYKINLSNFRENNFIKSYWYLIIQLFVKLPFLNLNVESEELKKLIDLINVEIKNKKLDFLNNQIFSHKSNLLIQENKKENNEMQKYIEEIKDFLMLEDDKKADDFLNLYQPKIWK